MKRCYLWIAACLFTLYVCVPLVWGGDFIALATSIGALVFGVKKFRALRAMKRLGVAP